MNINATLFLQAIVFAILVWFTMRFVWPPIAKALDERAAKIADGLAAADKAKSELATANKRVDEQLAQTRTETTKLLGDAEKRAAAIVEDAKRRAEEEARVGPDRNAANGVEPREQRGPQRCADSVVAVGHAATESIGRGVNCRVTRAQAGDKRAA